MRRLNTLIAFAGAVGLACASMGAPPGGPQRKEPPVILSVSPESGAVNVTDKSVIFEFDAIVSDRSGRAGELSSIVLVSPNDAGTTVKWRRNRIEIRPKRGFRPRTAYSVMLMPGIADLNNNAMKVGRTILFSTGDSIPPFAVHGRVFDWVAERIVVDAVVDVVRITDSLPYVGLSDSAGQFAVGPMEPNRYFVRAFMDNNHNRTLDPNEPWDTVSTAVTDASPFVEMRVVQRDTIAPRLLTVSASDSITLRASFDRLLDPGMVLTPNSFRIQAKDSSSLTIASVRTAAQEQTHRARADSITRDSIARAAGPPSVGAPAAPITERAAGPAAPAKPSAPPPIRDLVIVMEPQSPLHPGESYRVTAVNARGMLGPARTSDRVLAVPRADTTKPPVRKP